MWCSHSTPNSDPHAQCFQSFTASHDINNCDVCLSARPTFQQCRAIPLWNLKPSPYPTQQPIRITKLTLQLGSVDKATNGFSTGCCIFGMQSLNPSLLLLTLRLFLFLGIFPSLDCSPRGRSLAGSSPYTLGIQGWSRWHKSFENPVNLLSCRFLITSPFNCPPPHPSEESPDSGGGGGGGGAGSLQLRVLGQQLQPLQLLRFLGMLWLSMLLWLGKFLPVIVEF